MITRDILGKHILITGDVNSGKTTLARVALDLLCNDNLSLRITIIDLAPRIPEEIAAQRGLQGVGGKLIPTCENDVLYLSTEIRPPRLSSKSEEEAVFIAEENRAKIDDLLEEFLAAGRDILFINDVSMYLQAGDASVLLKKIEKASTVIANGYYGQKLGAGVLSSREAKEMERLIRSFPYHIQMPGGSFDDIPGNVEPGKR